MRLQLAVWHHTGIDPSTVVKTLVDAVAEEGSPEHPDAVVKAAVIAYVEGAHDQLAQVAVDNHGGVAAMRQSLDLPDDSNLRLSTSFPPAGTPEPEPDSEPPRRGDVIEPTPSLAAVAPLFVDDLGDVLEHIEAPDAPARIACSKVHWRNANVQTVVEDALIRTVMRCTCRQLSRPDPATAECIACGSRDCPKGHELHYHHDGCPECAREDVQ